MEQSLDGNVTSANAKQTRVLPANSDKDRCCSPEVQRGGYLRIREHGVPIYWSQRGCNQGAEFTFSGLPARIADRKENS